jgi:hypothetical protein
MGVSYKMRVIIAGSRDIEDYEMVKDAVEKSEFKITTVVSGTARGVDKLGERWAKENGIPIAPFPAKWRVDGIYNPGAGHIRNGEMAENADALIAVTNGSKGTANMIKQAQKKGLRVFVYKLFDDTEVGFLQNFLEGK